MTNEEFCAWINGYLTLSEEKALNSQKIDIIKNHANLVLAVENKLYPDIVDFLEKIDQKRLSDIKSLSSF